MKIKCEFCDNYIDDTVMACPYCGAPNEQAKRTGNGAPTTIEELKAWYSAHNLPPEEVTRFFIGKDVKEKRAFGIYQDPDTGLFIVYKNKDDGTRAVRYEGSDEKYAVNEIYQKLRSEIANQKERNKANRAAGNSGSSYNGNNKWHPSKKLIITIVVVFIALDVLGFVINKFIPDTSYYRYGGNDYYYDTEWYTYDTSLNDWTQAESVPSELNDNYQEYEIDSSSLGEGVSQYESEDSSSSSSYDDDDWDSSSSWDSSDSWDSSSSDWGSDW